MALLCHKHRILLMPNMYVFRYHLEIHTMFAIHYHVNLVARKCKTIEYFILQRDCIVFFTIAIRMATFKNAFPENNFIISSEISQGCNDLSFLMSRKSLLVFSESMCS